MVRELYTMGQYLAVKKYRVLIYAYLAVICGSIAGGITSFVTI